MKNKIMYIVSLVMVLALVVTGCGHAPTEQADTTKNTYGAEMRRTEQNHKGLSEKRPAPILDDSLERVQLSERLKRWNDPNKVAWIYLFTTNGQLIGFYTIKGKVSSVNSQLTASTQLVSDPNCIQNGTYGNCQSQQVESPDFDGSYGTNGNAIFFFSVDGTYIEWNGPYILMDKPVKLNVQPLMVQSTN